MRLVHFTFFNDLGGLVGSSNLNFVTGLGNRLVTDLGTTKQFYQLTISRSSSLVNGFFNGHPPLSSSEGLWGFIWPRLSVSFPSRSFFPTYLLGHT